MGKPSGNKDPKDVGFGAPVQSLPKHASPKKGLESAQDYSGTKQMSGAKGGNSKKLPAYLNE